MPDSQSNPIQESLRLMNRCPVCQKEYRPTAANILEKKSGAHLVHITCSHCQSAIIALILVSKLGTSTVGVITDLNANDVQRLKNSGGITEDELLDFYQTLKNNQI